MARKEEVLTKTCLLNVLPILTLGALEVLATDLERAVKGLNKEHDNGLREVAVAVRSFYQEAVRKNDRIDAVLSIDCR